jgi:predicted amidohydrolase YtcJ
MLAKSQIAEFVVSDAHIYTMDTTKPTASAIAFKDGVILAVGDDLSRYVGPKTRKIDGGGATIVPGFIDCHGHMSGLGDSLETLDLRNSQSIEEVVAIVQKAAAEREAGEWIRGRSWDQNNWGGEFPNAEALSRAAPDHPVYLIRVDGHAAWVNRKALEIARITSSTADPPGGKITRDPSGAPTGILIDHAQGLVASKIPAPTTKQVRNRLARAAAECARLGLTTVHDAGVSAQEISAYKTLIREGKFPLRVYAMIGGEGPLWQEYLKRGPEIGQKLTVRSIKLMADGAMGSRGAAFWKPYSDDPGNSGLLLISKEDIERVAREAAQHNFQVNTHAIGDRANRIVLDAYGAVLRGKNDRRFRIEHAQVVALDDFPLFAKYSIIASMQATHATSDMRWAEKRIGPERILGAYAWRRFLSMGVPVVNGSDFPVESPNPLWGFYAAVTRQDHQGNPKGGWFPEQRMTREEALRSWTLDGAYAAFEEKTKGSLAPGKVADFVMLSRDIMRIPPQEILRTRVLMTVVGGEIVYSR